MFNIKRLQEEWKQIGITDSEIAKLIDMKPQSLSRKLNKPEEHGDMKISQVIKICEVINRPVDLFVMRKKDK